MKTTIGIILIETFAALGWGGSIILGGPGDGINTDPFGGPFGLNPGTRYQQVYASADFVGLGPITITGIDFLGGSGSFAGNTYTISFAVVSAGIDSLSSSNFDANLGPNNTTIPGLNETTFASLVLGGAAPGTLTILGSVGFVADFVYIPSYGNLLLDVSVSPGGTAGDAAFLARSGTAEGIFSRYDNFNTGSAGYGLVTEFDYVLSSGPVFLVPGSNPNGVPEPESILFVATTILGLAGVLIFRNFTKTRKLY